MTKQDKIRIRVRKFVGERKPKDAKTPWITRRRDADANTPGGHLLALAKKEKP